jgi:glyoxylase-like metal-dependent hydrolase (beta-lactamase superfamily II)
MTQLEDDYTDIINKAQAGLSIGDDKLARCAGIPLPALSALKSGVVKHEHLTAVAPLLNLDSTSLLEIATGSWHPKPVSMAGLQQCSTHFHGMSVNSYLVWDPASQSAAIFDTGATCEPLLRLMSEHSLRVSSIFLTHAHRDHITDLSSLLEYTKAPAYSSEKDHVSGTKPIAYGDRFEVGALTISTRQTTGHTRGGVTYVVGGLTNPIAIVGDALFAGSMGGSPNAWAEALDTNRTAIFSLPDATIICPGHGPMTTVAEEKSHNPLFPEFKQKFNCRRLSAT